MARRKKIDDGMEERVLHIRRVSKKTTGGNYISFSALVVVGDGKGSVGVGMGRGLEVPPAIQKGIAQAKKNMIKIPLFNDTIPHTVTLKYKASRLLLKPAPPGTGLKVGGVVRVILDIAGVNNASGKIIGTRNQITNAYAIIEALTKLKPRIKPDHKDIKSKEQKSKESTDAGIKDKKSVKSKDQENIKSNAKKSPKSKATSSQKPPTSQTTASRSKKETAAKKVKKTTKATSSQSNTINPETKE